MVRLKKFYKEVVSPALIGQFGYKNVMQVPKIEKITLSMGVGEASRDKKVMDYAVSDLSLITAQKPLVTRSRLSIAGFKIREDMPIGCKVTLRGDRMYEFFDRFVNIAIPRIRDFRGFKSSSFDGRGGYSVGLKEQIIFPEIEYDKIDKIRGLNVTISTSAGTDKEAAALLKAFKFPIKD